MQTTILTVAHTAASKHKQNSCKDLCCWVLYPCYWVFFTHTNSNWLKRNQCFSYHAAALISGT